MMSFHSIFLEYLRLNSFFFSLSLLFELSDTHACTRVLSKVCKKISQIQSFPGRFSLCEEASGLLAKDIIENLGRMCVSFMRVYCGRLYKLCVCACVRCSVYYNIRRPSSSSKAQDEIENIFIEVFYADLTSGWNRRLLISGENRKKRD